MAVLLATAAAVFLASGLVAEARVVAIVHGVVPCSIDTVSMAAVSSSPVFANASVHLVVGGNDDGNLISTRTRTNSKGHFKMVLNVTSSDMMAALQAGGRVVVTTPPAACDSSLPAAGRLAAPLLPLGSRSLLAGAGGPPSPADDDDQLRDAIDDLCGFLGDPDRLAAAGAGLAVDLACVAVSLAVLLGGNDTIPAASYDVNSGTLDGFTALGVGPVSYSAAN
uniref:Uncharacterized protein n=1 Tax=Oryza brachyantha TaxID=4533 RepID=J3MB58_ORYBR